MASDAAKQRGEMPTFFISASKGENCNEVVEFIKQIGGL